MGQTVKIRRNSIDSASEYLRQRVVYSDVWPVDRFFFFHFLVCCRNACWFLSILHFLFLFFVSVISQSVCATVPDYIQGVRPGQIGHHELLRDEDGS